MIDYLRKCIKSNEHFNYDTHKIYRRLKLTTDVFCENMIHTQICCDWQSKEDLVVALIKTRQLIETRQELVSIFKVILTVQSLRTVLGSLSDSEKVIMEEVLSKTQNRAKKLLRESGLFSEILLEQKSI